MHQNFWKFNNPSEGKGFLGLLISTNGLNELFLWKPQSFDSLSNFWRQSQFIAFELSNWGKMDMVSIVPIMLIPSLPV